MSRFPFLSEDDHFKLIEKYFCEKGPIPHQFESYENLVYNYLQKIFDESNSISFETKISSYKATFGQIYFERASIIDENRNIKYITPNEARLRDLTYDSPIFVDIKEEFWENGEKVNTIQHPKVFLFRMPTMVRSSRCNLYGLSSDECIQLGECENCPGGYFIINGKERALICQERLNYNQVYLFDNNSEKFPHIAEIRSMSEETAHSVLLKAAIDKDFRNCCFSLPYMSKEVLAGSVFKALGFTNEEIVEIINPKTPEETKYTERLIRESIMYNTPEKALKYISKSSIQKVEDSEEQRIHYTKQVIDNELFPHMGISTNLEKALLLGSMINKLFRVCIGTRIKEDRDNVSIKRIEGPGVLLGDLFRMCLKRYCDNLKKYIEKRQDIITAISRTNSITPAIKSPMATGNWCAQKNTYVRTGVSQLMSRLTYPATISHLRRIVIPVGKEGKNVKIRQIHTSQCFFVDTIESPEGKGIGIIKNFALMSKLTVGCNTILVRKTIESCSHVVQTEKYFQSRNWNMIYVNGILIGLTENLNECYEELKRMKDEQLFSDQVSFFKEENEHELRVFCDAGRFMRPLIKVQENKPICTEEHEKMSWSDLIENDIVSYVDSNEVEQSLIAMYPSDLVQYSEQTYNYCEIHPSTMLGVCSAVIPYPEHNQCPRLVYEASMMKQALGVYALSHQQRFDTITHVMNYPQKPLIETKYNKMLHYDEMLTGCNPIVAISCYTGFNQEDSIILNRSSVDRGMFVTTAYRTLIHEERKKTNCSFEKIEIPPLGSQNKTMNYSKLGPNGIVMKGVPVYKGDIIVGKTLTKVQKEDEEKVDCSLSISSGEDGIVDNVWTGLNEEGYLMVKVKIRQIRIPEVGDKCACVDELTSVLTENGWKSIKNVTKDDKVATLQNGEILYEHPINTFTYDYEGKMYKLETQQLDMLVTPNHKLYIKKNEEYKLERADKIFGKKVVHKKNGEWKKESTVHDVKQLCDSLVKSYQEIKLKTHESNKLPKYVWNFSKEECLYLLKKLVSIQTDFDLSEDIQRLALHAGVSVNINTEITVGLNEAESENEEWIDFNDKVYCLEVPGNVFYVKRNGKPYWTGNSRSSQKGVCGLLLSQEDMPFTPQGITPDLIMNPHSQPSRMTTSQLIECMYGKVASMKGTFGDATAFTEQSTDPVEGIATMLKSYGFQKYGNEKLYNGFTGELLDSELFIGPTYYQRLKHMVADKIHCLTTDHEVLTLDGWKPILEITTSDLVATLHDNDELVYQNPINTFSYPEYEGMMYSITNSAVDLKTTGNHRMWVKTDKYDFVLSQNLVGKKVMYKQDAILNKNKYQFQKFDMKIWISLIGMYVSQEHFIYPDLFTHLLQQLKNDNVSNYLLEEYIEDYLSSIKNKLPEWVFELDKDQTKLLIKYMTLSRKDVFTTRLKILSDQFQQLCLHAGYTYKINHHYPIFMYLIDENKSLIVNNGEQQIEKWEREKCHVVCIEVPNQRFYVRRNGKSVWTGNSRSTGNVTMMHHQPSEGRSREGGLRVGEMERDALISHGGAAFIQETLFDMSDQYQVNVCEKCGNILSSAVACRICKTSTVNRTNIPYCAKLLFQELEAMGIKIQINTK